MVGKSIGAILSNLSPVHVWTFKHVCSAAPPQNRVIWNQHATHVPGLITLSAMAARGGGFQIVFWTHTLDRWTTEVITVYCKNASCAEENMNCTQLPAGKALFPPKYLLDLLPALPVYHTQETTGITENCMFWCELKGQGKKWQRKWEGRPLLSIMTWFSPSFPIIQISINSWETSKSKWSWSTSHELAEKCL